MHSLWVGIDSRPPAARILVMAGAEDAVLKARLLSAPKHPRAFATLLEASPA